MKNNKQEWEKEFARGTSQRLELQKLLENYKNNPSNGNRHEEAIIDFMLFHIRANFIPKERVEEAINKLGNDPPESNEARRAYYQALSDLRKELLGK